MSEQEIDRHRIEGGLRPVLVAAMLACLAAPIVTLIAQLAPRWPGSYLFVFSFFANLEGILSERLLKRQRITGWAYLGSRAAEAITLLLLLKLGSYQGLGWGQLWVDAQRWAVAPAEIITLADALAGLPLLILWMAAISLSQSIAQLDAVPDAPPEDQHSPEYYLWLTQPQAMIDRHETLQRLGERFLFGGAVLLLALVAVRLVYSESRLFLLPALGYFALGIVLLSQAQFSVLRATWQVQRIEVQPTIARRWLAWAAAFLAVVTLAALWLPTTYSLLPLQALLGVLSLLAYGGMFVLTMILYLGGSLLSLIFPGMAAPSRPTPPPPPPPAPGAETPSPGSPWLQTLLSALFWLVVLAIVVYSVIRFARERGSAAEGEDGWWDQAVDWLRAMWLRWLGWRKRVRGELGKRLARQARSGPGPRGPGAAAPGRWLALRRLAPRELVRYFYLSTLERASRAGLGRRAGQTPYEYRAALEHELPEVEPEVARLTDAFVVARYSRKPVGTEEARAVKPLWERVREALRRRSHKELGSGR